MTRNGADPEVKNKAQLCAPVYRCGNIGMLFVTARFIMGLEPVNCQTSPLKITLSFGNSSNLRERRTALEEFLYFVSKLVIYTSTITRHLGATRKTPTQNSLDLKIT